MMNSTEFSRTNIFTAVNTVYSTLHFADAWIQSHNFSYALRYKFKALVVSVDTIILIVNTILLEIQIQEKQSKDKKLNNIHPAARIFTLIGMGIVSGVGVYIINRLNKPAIDIQSIFNATIGLPTQNSPQISFSFDTTSLLKFHQFILINSIFIHAISSIVNASYMQLCNAVLKAGSLLSLSQLKWITLKRLDSDYPLKNLSVAYDKAKATIEKLSSKFTFMIPTTLAQDKNYLKSIVTTIHNYADKFYANCKNWDCEWHLIFGNQILVNRNLFVSTFKNSKGPLFDLSENIRPVLQSIETRAFVKNTYIGIIFKKLYPYESWWPVFYLTA